jgi:hypothetical protein
MQPASGSTGSPPPLLQQVRDLTRALHLSIRTEEAYVRWIAQFLRYHRQLAGHWRHPAEMDSGEVNQFLTQLVAKVATARPHPWDVWGFVAGDWGSRYAPGCFSRFPPARE